MLDQGRRGAPVGSRAISGRSYGALLRSLTLPVAFALLNVIGFSPSAMAAQPPLWCEYYPGNSFAGGCITPYFSSRLEAAQALSERDLKAVNDWCCSVDKHYLRRWNGPLIYPEYNGPRPHNIWRRDTIWLNTTVEVRASLSGSIFPVCPVLNGTRATPLPGDESQACPSSEQLSISVVGPNSTKALPAGPVLPQTVKVKLGSAAASGRSVCVAIEGVGNGSACGTTDSAGEFKFNYVPPWLRAATQKLTATCDGCSNKAEKTVTVQACDICEGAQ